MQRAIELAKIAKSNQEIPIGCVIVDPKGLRVLAECYDSRATTRHPLKHAIIKCLDVVTSVESCNTFTTQHDYGHQNSLKRKIDDVCYGNPSIVAGGLESCFKLHTHNSLNHHFKVFEGRV
nr:12940_t:CDS:2 [Entrophospora candida]